MFAGPKLNAPADPLSNAKGNSSHGRNSKQTMASQAGLSLERPQQAEGFEMGAPMSMAEDLVKLAREAFKACRPVDRVACQDFGMQQDDILDQQLAAALAATHAYYAAVINTQAASLAAKDKEIERLRAADPRTSLLTVIADIREKTGVGGKPMLNELADAIAAEIDQRVADEREKCAKVAEAEYADKNWHMMYRHAADVIAAAIRSGGAK